MKLLDKIWGILARVLALLMFVITGIYSYQGKFDEAAVRMTLAIVLMIWAKVENSP